MNSCFKWSTYLGVFFIAICLFIQKGLAIECFICNSYLHGDDCRDLPEDRQYLYRQECDDLEGNKTYTMCRKSVQKYKSDDRIIRQCASIGDIGCIKRTGTKDINFLYCHCDEPQCNRTPGFSITILTVLSAVIFTCSIPRIVQ